MTHAHAEAERNSKTAMAKTLSKVDLAAAIDHTTLSPETTLADVERVCNEAIEHGFASVCIPPHFVNAAKGFLKRKPVNISTVIGFPLGYNATATKVAEGKKAIEDGAHELDMVINLAAYRSGQKAHVKDEMTTLAMLCHLHNRKLKVILETAVLSEEEIMELCDMCVASEVDFVKTSTGFSPRGGTTVEVVKLLRANLPPSIKIKASGGIRTADFALALLEAGADRLGTSAGIDIIR
jgi:deoxyribose-phosphate aldolase